MPVFLEIIEKLLSDLIACHYEKNCSTVGWSEQLNAELAENAENNSINYLSANSASSALKTFASASV